MRRSSCDVEQCRSSTYCFVCKPSAIDQVRVIVMRLETPRLDGESVRGSLALACGERPFRGSLALACAERPVRGSREVAGAEQPVCRRTQSVRCRHRSIESEPFRRPRCLPNAAALLEGAASGSSRRRRRNRIREHPTTPCAGRRCLFRYAHRARPLPGGPRRRAHRAPLPPPCSVPRRPDAGGARAPCSCNARDAAAAAAHAVRDADVDVTR